MDFATIYNTYYDRLFRVSLAIIRDRQHAEDNVQETFIKAFKKQDDLEDMFGEARARELMREEQPFLMAGDFNLIPQPEDAKRPEAWKDDALFRLESRAAFRRLMNLGFTDALRVKNNAPETYTFWDYQGGAFDKNDGIRIDHFLLSPQAADLLRDCQIDAYTRAKAKPSDHVPIWVDLDL